MSHPAEGGTRSLSWESRPSSGSSRPLEGVLVVSVEQAVAAPLATRKLADAGARVIKVERPEGDFARGYDRLVRGGSSHFVWLNRGKESVALDFKDPRDAELLHRMIAAADIFLQNLAPGAAARAGFASTDVRRAHPRLVTCDLTGYGESGPYAVMKAYDNLVQGEVGLQAVTGTPEAPARVGISICDIAAGMHAYEAVLEALLRRERTGRGASLSVSLFDSVADWMAVPYLLWTYAGRAPERSGLAHPGIAPYGPFRAADGEVLLVAVQNEREWARLCGGVLEAPELAADARFGDNPGRVAHREALDAALQERFAALPAGELAARLRRHGIAFGRVNSVGVFAVHPQLRLLEVQSPWGEVRMPAAAVVWRDDDPDAGGEGGREAARRTRVPGLDEHGAALRAEFAPGGSP